MLKNQNLISYIGQIVMGFAALCLALKFLSILLSTCLFFFGVFLLIFGYWKKRKKEGAKYSKF
ncbi:hypothetical protein MXL46_20920 [Heyndrickxia sporothermodurans]|uniref:hypothetical protein n=1 Tax=Bacilli TaxID=91061 RepID=UPI0012E1FFCD|nr:MULTISPECIES: hypothetical protein [Bacilli]MEB6551471.1 hypothetical protein [Heyndrickxia sporothermodurans]QGU39462.1 hypothetical protein F5989_00055 [Streptococcus mutans]HAJ4014854.1 hypothetical protein [Escherichia coli]